MNKTLQCNIHRINVAFKISTQIICLRTKKIILYYKKVLTRIIQMTHEKLKLYLKVKYHFHQLKVFLSTLYAHENHILLARN